MMAYSVSVCICTRNRPTEIKKALDSLIKSTYSIFEVIVSDDSTNQDTEVLIKSHYPEVKYLKGPKVGLGANRNNALKNITGSHVLFIDDDVVLGEYFLENIFSHLENHITQERSESSRVIVTGIESRNGVLVFPSEQTYLGHQEVEYQEGAEIKTVVINSSVFPSNIFDEMLFDEKLVYGCDEVDFTTRSVAKGYKILLCSSAINFHFPSTINREFYQPYHESSRIYVTFKRYFSTDRNKLKAVIYLSISLIHAFSHSIKSEGFQGVVKSFLTLRIVTSYILTEYFLRPSRVQSLSKI